MSERYTYLRCMRNIAIPTIILSVVCIGVGIASIAQSAPYYTFPFCLGGGMISGLASLLAAYFHIKLYRMHVNNGRDDYNDISWRYQMVFVGTFLLLALIIGLGLSGIWGMVEANDLEKAEVLFPSENSSVMAEYGRKNLGYAIATFVLVFVLCILKCIAYCACQCYFNDFETGHNYSARSIGNRRDPTPITIPRTSQPRPTISRQTDNDDTSSTNHNGNSRHMVPTTQNILSYDAFSSVEISDSNNSDNVAMHTAPPRYEDVCEPPPPSYGEVLEQGAYTVLHV